MVMDNFAGGGLFLGGRSVLTIDEEEASISVCSANTLIREG